MRDRVQTYIRSSTAERHRQQRAVGETTTDDSTVDGARWLAGAEVQVPDSKVIALV